MEYTGPFPCGCLGFCIKTRDVKQNQNMKTPLVSIIIPCYNSAAFVKRAIESALHQTYPNTEIILVDNNSVDGTLGILKNYQQKHPEKITVLTEKRQGQPSCRNKGIAGATGEYIQMLDSDDELLPQKIANQISAGVEKPPDLVVGNYLSIRRGKAYPIKAHPDQWVGLVASKLGITSSLLWRRDAVIKAGWFSERWSSSDEYELMFRILKSGGRLVYTPAYQTRVFWRDESVGKSKDPQRLRVIWRQRFGFRMQIRDYLEENGTFTKETKYAWEKYMYPQLVHLKYQLPEIYNEFMPLINHDLPVYQAYKPIIAREIRQGFHKVFNL